MFMSEDVFTDKKQGEGFEYGGRHAPPPLAGDERQVYLGGSGAPAARPGTASMPVRPVSARSWGTDKASVSSTGGVTVYTNDLFNDEGGEEPGLAASAPSNPQLAQKQRLEQQKKLAAEKRKERSMMSGAVVKSNARPGSAAGRPGSARPSRPGSALSRPAAAIGRDSFNMGGLNSALDGRNDEYEDDTGAQEVKDSLSKQGLREVYDPATSPTGGIGSHREPVVPRTVDTSDMRVFLLQAGPANGPILCHIRRTKVGMFPRYQLFLGGDGELNGDEPGCGERFLLSARKRKKSKSSNYLISLDEEDMSRQSGNFFGKLRSNFLGTEFTIYDKGVKPKEASHGGSQQPTIRSELGAVLYQYNVLGTRGPRKMTALIPRVDSRGQRHVFKEGENKSGVLDRFKDNQNSENLTVMQNKPPKWNEQMQAYCLNFHGRVKLASVKNFQLVSDENKDHIILQFGKVGKDTFTMDYQYPMSAVQAFSICLTSFDNKLACE